MSVIHRQLSDKLRQAAQKMPVISLTGPRQSGKTTLARAAFPDHVYVNLENPPTRRLALENPVGFLDQFTQDVIIDEAQYAPELFSYIQVRVAGTPYAVDNPFEYIFRGSFPRVYDQDVPTEIFYPASIQNWTSFGRLAPDLLRGAENCPTMPQTHGGEYCVGLIHYMPALDIGQQLDYHALIQGKLLRPLRPGTRYRLELGVREDSALMRQHLSKVYGPKTLYAPVRAGNLGFCFVVESLGSEMEFSWLAKKYNLHPQVNFTEIIATNGEWVKLSTTFVADQPAQYFVVGNFFPDIKINIDLPEERRLEIEQQNARIENPMKRIKRVGYVCIDDISIVPESPASDKPVDLATQLLTERKYTFSAGVLFDSGEATLRPEAGPELDKLAEFLQKHPTTRLGIAGHTDDVGSGPDNLDLSGRRAKAEYDFLLNKGIATTRIQWKGFGETRPVADNATEAGHQQNRRVECVVL